MYHAVARARAQRIWRRIGDGDYRPAVAMAAPDLRFRFIGDTPLGADLHGRDAFEEWFRALFDRFPGIRLTLTDVVVQGWPWDTAVVIRLDVAATLADGSVYRNEAIQWTRLRWGRMVSDVVLEDTQRLADACERQDRARQDGAPTPSP